MRNHISVLLTTVHFCWIACVPDAGPALDTIDVCDGTGAPKSGGRARGVKIRTPSGTGLHGRNRTNRLLTQHDTVRTYGFQTDGGAVAVHRR